VGVRPLRQDRPWLEHTTSGGEVVLNEENETFEFEFGEIDERDFDLVDGEESSKQSLKNLPKEEIAYIIESSGVADHFLSLWVKTTKK
jgi:hypothetical protein